jgi:hypothetical protein
MSYEYESTASSEFRASVTNYYLTCKTCKAAQSKPIEGLRV